MARAKDIRARAARNNAALVRFKDVAKAVAYLRQATDYDPGDAQTWDDLARAAKDAGDTRTAMTAFQEAAKLARDGGDDRNRYWATLGMGDIALAQGSLPSARRLYETAGTIAERLANSDPGNAGWQRDLWVSYWRLARYEPRDYWPRVVAKLEDMKRRGILLPTDERFIVIAKEQAAKVK